MVLCSTCSPLTPARSWSSVIESVESVGSEGVELSESFELSFMIQWYALYLMFPIVVIG